MWSNRKQDKIGLYFHVTQSPNTGQFPYKYTEMTSLITSDKISSYTLCRIYIYIVAYWLLLL